MLIRGPRPEANFTQIRNDMLRDTRLSCRAKGLLCLMLSYPEGWTTSSERLTRLVPEGRDAVRNTLRELESAGYLHRRASRDASGKFTHDQIISDIPMPENPSSDNQSPGNQSPET